MVLIYSGTTHESFADTEVGFINFDTIWDDPHGVDNNNNPRLVRLNNPSAMVPFNLNGQQYILVSSSGEGLHLVLVDNQGGLSARDAVGDTVAKGNAIDTAQYVDKDGITRVLALWRGIGASGQGVQTFALAANHQINHSPLDTITAITDVRLNEPQALDVYSPSAGKTYAVVVGGISSPQSNVVVINVTDPRNIAITDSIKDSDSSSYKLQQPTDVAIYTVGTKHYAVVVSNNESSLTILDITDPMDISVVGSITDDGNTLMRYALKVDVFSIGNKYYAVTAPNTIHEDGIQIIDISTPSAPTAVGKLDKASNNRYRNYTNLATHTYNDNVYVLLTAERDRNAVTIIDVTDPNNPVEKAWVHEPTNRSDAKLRGAHVVNTYVHTINGNERHFAVVGSLGHTQDTSNHGIQLLELVFLTADAGPDQTRTYGQTVMLNGSASSVTDPSKTFSYAWTQTGSPTVNLTGANTASPTFTAPNQDATLTFTLTVTLPASQGVVKTGAVDNAGTITTTDTVTIRVSAVPNQPPTANAGADKTVTPGSTVTLSGSGTDPDGNDADLRYEWEQTSITSETPTVAIDNSRSAQTTFTAPPDPTELEFTLTVFDRTDSATDVITITIKEQTQTRNIKELKDTLIQGQITEPTQSTDPDQVGDTDLITGSNEITMIYTEPIATFINSYLNFTISGEEKSRNITGINGSPAIETGETVLIDGKQVKTYSTILTFDGPPVPPGSTGSMYVQHADYYLAKIQIRDGQN